MRRESVAGLGGFACLAMAILIAAPRVSSLADLKLTRVLELRGATYHVQGVEFDLRTLWATSVDSAARKTWLHEFSLATGEQTRAVELQDGDRFHAGGLTGDGSSLWIPVAEYRAGSSSVIQRRNKRTLRLEYQFAVADHIGCVAATPQFLVGGNWDSREFYLWDRLGRLIRKVPNTAGNRYQDMKFDGGQIVASGLLPGGGGAVDWLDVPSLRLARRMAAGQTSRGVPYTREGMAIRAGVLALLPEDGPSRVFFFRLKRP